MTVAKRAELGATLIGLARKRIAWEKATAAGEARPTTAPGLPLGAALLIRREARSIGVWPEGEL